MEWTFAEIIQNWQPEDWLVAIGIILLLTTGAIVLGLMSSDSPD